MDGWMNIQYLLNALHIIYIYGYRDIDINLILYILYVLFHYIILFFSYIFNFILNSLNLC